MSKKKQHSGLGRTIIKDRFGKKNRAVGDSFLHTSELQDGYDWGRLNLQSVTEQNNLEDFLATAELAGTEFTAEKLNVKFISQDTGGLPKADEIKAIQGLHKQHENLLRIPRRPPWNKEMSTSEVDQNEKLAFLDWRRSLAKLQEDERIVMTPYEKNLDFWRQLWRVIERSDIVVQIVDARNPLLFYCADLEQYVGEINQNKLCLLLINKADYLSVSQRDTWAAYFTKRGVRIAFWSAVDETNRQEAENKKHSDDDEMGDENSDSDVDGGSDEDNNDDEIDADENVDKIGSHTNNDENVMQTDETSEGKNIDDFGTNTTDSIPNSDNKNSTDTVRKSGDDITDNTGMECAEELETKACDSDLKASTCASLSQTTSMNAGALDGSSGSGDHIEDVTACSDCSSLQTDQIRNSSQVYTGPELLELFKGLHVSKDSTDALTTVGMVGYPNVGKSSSINAILKVKKVPVSATPGRTKHFQTVYVDNSLMLCDCPGLVFPSFVTTKADLVVSGILPIDQMRDCIPPTTLLCQRIPRWMLETSYGINLPAPGEAEDPNRPPTAHELLNVYGGMRGYMTAHGVPDGPRSSRYILKDYVNGKLLYCHPPPEHDPVQFNDYQSLEPASKKQCVINDAGAPSSSSDTPVVPSKIDPDFFQKNFSTIHTKSAPAGKDGAASDNKSQSSASDSKPWKKHNNKKKKEKLRRVYGYLDK